MKALIRWAIDNSPAMNTLMLTLLLIGGLSLATLRREVLPDFDLEIIIITVPYPGASPGEVEEGVCQKLEEAVQSIRGIRRISGLAREDSGHVVLELADGQNVQRVLNEVRAEIDRIPSLPERAEDPSVEQMTLRTPAIKVGVVGPPGPEQESELLLRTIAESIHDDLRLLPSVAQVNLVNVRDYQMDVEISEHTLRRYGLSLQQVAQTIRRENIELPGGRMTTDTRELLLRGKNKGLTGDQIAQIPLVTAPNGVVLTIGDVGRVRDEFDDSTAGNWINGRPGIVLSVDRTSGEDLIRITEEVKDFVDSRNPQMPPGFQLVTWEDASIDVRDRLHLLLVNGLQGLILVFLVLAIFLELKLAFWVALGIPIALAGAGMALGLADQTLNMLTMFAFLLVLGIVVDDAIVIGENIFAHRRRNETAVSAAVQGTIEVLPAVTTSILTTVLAFLPLFFVSGIMGKFIAVLPLAVIAMLLVSLTESALILPCHLAHRDGPRFRLASLLLFPLRPVAGWFARANRTSHWLVYELTRRLYLPALDWTLSHRAIVVSSAVAMLIFTIGLPRSGITPWVLFPSLDSKLIEAEIVYPDGTPGHRTKHSLDLLRAALEEVDRQFEQPVVQLVHVALGQITEDTVLGAGAQTRGSHMGGVYVELVDPAQRQVTSDEILRRWRQQAGSFDGAERLIFSATEVGPAGQPIEFNLLAPNEHVEQLQAAAQHARRRLTEYQGVFDIRDNSLPGKWEYQLRVKDRSLALGVTAADLAETVRASYFGEEAMRLQRGRHEIKLMVRFPPEQRRSLAEFQEIRVRGSDGIDRPLTELAEVDVQRGYSEIHRINQLRSITITADVDQSQANAHEIVQDLQADFIPELLATYPTLRVDWEGQQGRMEESLNSLMRGFLVAVFAMYGLLTFQFRSYMQPLIILMIIPFGVIGAIWGHVVMGLTVTIFSVFGIVALTGVVVNDSIVLVDFVNQRIEQGIALRTALLEAGRRRLRPILLTSLTTVAGLTPILMERSFQAQFLIPMAASLAFGLLASTFLVLFVVPTFYHVYAAGFFPRAAPVAFGKHAPRPLVRPRLASKTMHVTS